MDPCIHVKDGQRDLEVLMDPHIISKEGQRDPETSWTRRYICKEAPKPHGPVYEFEGWSKRPRNLYGPV
jgi:hypothetical protein